MFRKSVLWILTILWMLLIFSFSAQTATESSEVSQSVTVSIIKRLPVIRSMSPDEQDSIAKMVHNTVRKIAHFTIYAVLGVLVFLLLQSYDISLKQCFLWTILICFLYAVSDEIHQLFSAGRGCRVFDMFLDTVGAAVGSFAVYFLQRLVNMIKKKRPFA